MKKRKSTTSRRYLYLCVGVLLVAGLAVTDNGSEPKVSHYGAEPIAISSVASSVCMQLNDAAAKQGCTEWHIQILVPAELDTDRNIVVCDDEIYVSPDTLLLPLTVGTPRTTGCTELPGAKAMCSPDCKLLILAFGLVGFFFAGTLDSKGKEQH